MSSPYRLAILTSHPIQYQAPLFRALAAHPRIDLTVYFCSRFGVESFHDPGFGARFSWDVPLLDGYRHVFLRNWSPKPRVSRFWGVVNPGTVSALLDTRPDALLIYGWARATYWLAFAASRFGHIPILIRGDSNPLASPDGIKALGKNIVLSTLFDQVSACLAAGSLNRAFYEQYGVPSDRIVFAPFSVDNAYFRARMADLPTKSDLRIMEGIPHEATVFLFCGKLTPAKRPLDLLEAFATIPDRDDMYLVYAGDGELRDAIHARSRSLGLHNVRVTGFQNQSELPRWYALSDVLVLPSAFEPWGLVVNEAMNFGLPVVTSNRVGAAPDLVRNGETGYVYPVGDVTGLTDIMRRLAADAQLRCRLSRNACREIERWDIEETVAGYLTALTTVIGRL